MYDRSYFEQYDIGIDVVDYDSSELIKLVLDRVAADLVSYLRVDSTLDVGCATGHLVRSFLRRGVDAYGVDVSGYAVDRANADPVLSGRVRIIDVSASPLFGWYDLVTCIEVLEHIKEERALFAIANMCAITNNIYFSSTPDQDRNSHVNMHEASYWIDAFGRNGFVVDDEFYSAVIPHGMLFRRVVS